MPYIKYTRDKKGLPRCSWAVTLDGKQIWFTRRNVPRERSAEESLARQFDRAYDKKKWLTDNEGLFVSLPRQLEKAGLLESPKEDGYCPTLSAFTPDYFKYAIGRTLSGEGVDRAKTSLKHLNQFLHDRRLKDISPKVVDEFVSNRKAEICTRTKRLYAPKSINLEVTELSSVMEAAIRLDILEEHPFKTPKRTLTSYFLKTVKKAPTVLFTDEIKLMFDAVQDNAHSLSVFLFLILSGMRKSELSGLRWDNVDFANKRITFNAPKTDDFRSIPLSEVLYRLLQFMQNNWPDPVGTRTWMPRNKKQMTWVFCDRNGKPYGREIGRFLKALAEKVGIRKKVTPHVLRHSFAAYGRSSLTVFQLQGLLGHKSVTTTEKYGTLMDTGMREGADMVAKNMGLDGPLNPTPIRLALDSTGTDGKPSRLSKKIGSPTGNRTPI